MAVDMEFPNVSMGSVVTGNTQQNLAGSFTKPAFRSAVLRGSGPLPVTPDTFSSNLPPEIVRTLLDEDGLGPGHFRHHPELFAPSSMISEISRSI